MDYEKIIIGVDIGTSGCKVLAINEFCKLIDSVTVEYPCHFPKPGWTEQNPVDWLDGMVKALNILVNKLDKDKICAVGLSGQMHGMVALDENNKVVRNAILWNDQRTKKQCDEIVKMAGGAEGLLSYTNNPMLTGFTAGKILWMKENEPENYEKTKTIVNPKDYIAFYLTEALSTDVSDASGTGLFDVKNRKWSKELIEKCGIDFNFFKDVKESSDVVGYVTETASLATGIPKCCPVFAGGGDAVLSTIGMGAGNDKQIAIMLGTSGVISKHSEKFSDNLGGKLQFSRACVPNMYHVMGVTLAAAGSYKWFCENFSAEDGDVSFKDFDKLAEKSNPGANGVLFLPYLFGERCPVNDENASACFIGVKANNTKADFTRAVLEGVAFSLKQVFDLMENGGSETNQVIMAGGGAKSPLWRQIFSDVFGLPVYTIEGGAEGSGFGAAIVAGIGAEVWKSLEEATKNLLVKTKNLPTDENAVVYGEIYKNYCTLYPKLKN